jgi:hypothetical protein
MSVLPPRLHRCGHQLSRVHVYEIIPAGHWTYQEGRFVLTDSTEEGDEVYLELKCPHCGETLNTKERKWFLGIQKEDE